MARFISKTPVDLALPKDPNTGETCCPSDRIMGCDDTIPKCSNPAPDTTSLRDVESESCAPQSPQLQSDGIAGAALPDGTGGNDTPDSTSNAPCPPGYHRVSSPRGGVDINDPQQRSPFCITTPPPEWNGQYIYDVEEAKACSIIVCPDGCLLFVPCDYNGLNYLFFCSSSDPKQNPLDGRTRCVPDEPSEPEPDSEPPSQDYNNCCDKTADALAKLAKILEEMADKTEKKLCDRLDELDGCMDELVNKIKDKLLPPVKTCDQCCQRVKIGLMTETECKATFANCKCSECVDSCGAHNMTQDGDCCKGCGKEKCVCKGYECVPAEEEEEQQYTGYCNRQTGEVYVTSFPEDRPPNSQFVKVSTGKTFDEAEQAAVRACQSSEPDTKPPPYFPEGGVSASTTPQCDILTFTVPGAINGIYKGTVGAQLAGQIVNQIFNSGRSIAEAISDIPVIGGIASNLTGSSISKLIGAIASGPVIAGIANCSTGGVTDVAVTYSSLSAMCDIAGLNINDVAPQFNYALKSSCRNAHLSVPEAVSSYLANGINYAQLDAYFAIDGQCHESVDRLIQAGKTKLSPGQLVAAKARGLVDDNGYLQGMRENGYVDRQYVDFNWILSEQLPGLADIIRFMVRDADDDQIAKRFGLDDEFDRKYARQLKEWSEWQRIPENVAKYAWRAHWSIPSPTQLFEFWRRLRKNEKFGGEDKLRDDIKEALIQQDVLPYWHDHYLAVSTLPLTRTDTRRAYEIGSLDRDGVLRAYIDAGYDDDNAEILTKFTEKLKTESAHNAKPIKLWLRWSIDGAEARRLMADRGYDDDQINDAMRFAESQFISSIPVNQFIIGHMPAHSVRVRLSNHGLSNDGVNSIISRASLNVRHHVSIDNYLSGTITLQEARGELLTYGVDSEKADSMLSIAKAKIARQKYVRCQRGLRRRYLTGDIPAADFEATVRTFGFTNERAMELKGMYDCEMVSTGKAVPANTLCGWLERGAITPTDFVTRMERIGYAPENARQLMNDCLAKISVQRQRNAERELAQEAREKERSERAAKRRLADAEKAEAKLARMRKQAEATRKRRQKQQLSIAAKLEQKCTCELADIVEFISGEVKRIQTRFGVSIDESLQAGIKAAEAWDGGELQSFSPVYDEMADSLVRASIASALAGEP